MWRRYEQLQDQLAHEASNFLLKMAVAAGCSVIAGEWLGSLRSGTRSKDLNWRINSQIRSKILEKLRYKCKRVGIRVAEVWPRGMYRPRWCGTRPNGAVPARDVSRGQRPPAANSMPLAGRDLDWPEPSWSDVLAFLGVELSAGTFGRIPCNRT